MMEHTLMQQAGESAEERKSSEQQRLNQRLQRVPKGWVCPLASELKKAPTDRGSPLHALVISERKGEFTRVRYTDDDLGTKLLLNEFEALQAVQHENVVILRWSRRSARSLLVATSWRQIDRKEPAPFPLPWLLDRMAGAARGVSAIHRAGLVHGDLKPATIRMGESWTLVSDLQCAAPPGRRKRALFTPRFAAPEQILGDPVGPAADLYALGMTLYTLFIAQRFPLILRGAKRAAEEPEMVSGTEQAVAESALLSTDETPSLSATTALGYRSAMGGRDRPAAHREKPVSIQGLDFLIGVKVRFRSRLNQVLEGVQHAGLVGEVLRIVRTATQLEPTGRFKTCEEFEGAITGLLRQLQGLDSLGPRETP